MAGLPRLGNGQKTPSPLRTLAPTKSRSGLSPVEYPMDADTSPMPFGARYHDDPAAAVIARRGEAQLGVDVACSVATGKAPFEAVVRRSSS